MQNNTLYRHCFPARTLVPAFMLSKTNRHRGSSHSKIFDSSVLSSVLMPLPLTIHFHMGLLKFVQGLSKQQNTKVRENPAGCTKEL